MLVAALLLVATVRGEPYFMPHKVYWTNYLSGSIQRATSDDGEGAETLISGRSLPWGLALDEPRCRMYWAEYGEKAIMRSHLDGGIAEMFIKLSSGPLSMWRSPDDDMLYWVQDNARIFRTSLVGDGKVIEEMLTRRSRDSSYDGQRWGIAIDSAMSPPEVYFSEPRDWTISKQVWGTSRQERPFVADERAVYVPAGVAIDPINRHLYWADEGEEYNGVEFNDIRRVSLDGDGKSDLRVVYKGVSKPQAVAVDADSRRLAVSDVTETSHRIVMISMDGGLHWSLGLPTSSFPRGIVFMNATETASAVCFTSTTTTTGTVSSTTTTTSTLSTTTVTTTTPTTTTQSSTSTATSTTRTFTTRTSSTRTATTTSTKIESTSTRMATSSTTYTTTSTTLTTLSATLSATFSATTSSATTTTTTTTQTATVTSSTSSTSSTSMRTRTTTTSTRTSTSSTTTATGTQSSQIVQTVTAQTASSTSSSTPQSSTSLPAVEDPAVEEVLVVTGRMSIDVSDPAGLIQAFAAEPTAVGGALAAGLAAALPEVEPGMVQVLGIGGASSRRLAQGGVVVRYRIDIPAHLGAMSGFGASSLAQRQDELPLALTAALHVAASAPGAPSALSALAEGLQVSRVTISDVVAVIEWRSNGVVAATSILGQRATTSTSTTEVPGTPLPGETPTVGASASGAIIGLSSAGALLLMCVVGACAWRKARARRKDRRAAEPIGKGHCADPKWDASPASSKGLGLQVLAISVHEDASQHEEMSQPEEMPQPERAEDALFTADSLNLDDCEEPDDQGIPPETTPSTPSTDVICETSLFEATMGYPTTPRAQTPTSQGASPASRAASVLARVPTGRLVLPAPTWEMPMVPDDLEAAVEEVRCSAVFVGARLAAGTPRRSRGSAWHDEEIAPKPADEAAYPDAAEEAWYGMGEAEADGWMGEADSGQPAAEPEPESSAAEDFPWGVEPTARETAYRPELRGADGAAEPRRRAAGVIESL